MFNNIPMTKKTNSRKFCENMLSVPNSKDSILLFELMANYKKGLSSSQIYKVCDVAKVGEEITKLKAKGLQIQEKKTKSIRYYLLDFKNAVEVYETLIENNNKPV